MDRNSQFQPIISLLTQLLQLRITADNATTALAANAATVNKLLNAYLAAKQKAGPFSGAQADDFIALGNAQNAYNLEAAKTAGLQAAATAAVEAFRQMWSQGDGFYQSLLQDPGMQEVV